MPPFSILLLSFPQAFPEALQICWHDFVMRISRLSSGRRVGSHTYSCQQSPNFIVQRDGLVLGCLSWAWAFFSDIIDSLLERTEGPWLLGYYIIEVQVPSRSHQLKQVDEQELGTTAYLNLKHVGLCPTNTEELAYENHSIEGYYVSATWPEADLYQ